MADITTGDAPKGGAGKKFGGQPLWVWGLGAAVVAGGYLYFHGKSATTTPAPADSSQQPAAAGPAAGQDQFMVWLLDHMNHPGSTKTTTTTTSTAGTKPNAGGPTKPKKPKKKPKKKPRPRIKWPKPKKGKVPV